MGPFDNRRTRFAAIDNPLQQGLKRSWQAGRQAVGDRRNRQSTTTGIETREGKEDRARRGPQ